MLNKVSLFYTVKCIFLLKMHQNALGRQDPLREIIAFLGPSSRIKKQRGGEEQDWEGRSEWKGRRRGEEERELSERK